MKVSQKFVPVVRIVSSLYWAVTFGLWLTFPSCSVFDLPLQDPASISFCIFARTHGAAYEQSWTMNLYTFWKIVSLMQNNLVASLETAYSERSYEKINLEGIMTWNQADDFQRGSKFQQHCSSPIREDCSFWSQNLNFCSFTMLGRHPVLVQSAHRLLNLDPWSFGIWRKEDWQVFRLFKQGLQTGRDYFDHSPLRHP